MKIGMITCNYFMRIYGYAKPEDFQWGAMTDKYRAEFTKADFLEMAQEIRDMGYGCLEIWEPNFSHKVYAPADATILAGELKEMGFEEIVYCIGGWGSADVSQVRPAYEFAKALGAAVVTGCVIKENSSALLDEMEARGKELGIRFAIENHPTPNFEDFADIAEAIKGYAAVGANIDAGIYNMQGYDVIEAAALLKEKIYHVHFKDTCRGKDECLPIGDGDAPMAALLRNLRDGGYDGMVSVEFEREGGDPAPGLIRSLAYIRGVLAR